MNALLLAALLAGAPPHPMSAGEATAIANREVHRVLPRFDRRSRTVRTDDSDGDWRVVYASPGYERAGGLVIVIVNKRSRRARIVQSPQ